VQKIIHVIVTSMVAGLLLACGPAQTPLVSKAEAIEARPEVTINASNLASKKGVYTLVMLGDSLTAGLGLNPKAAFPHIVQTDLAARKRPLKVINAGVSGDTSAGALARFNWSVGPEADGVFIAIGANDILNGLDPAQTRRNLAAMIEQARERKLDVFLAGMRAPPNFGTAYGEAFFRLYGEIADENCVPLYGFLLHPLVNAKGTALDQRFVQRDGLHPTKAGAARIGHALSQWLAIALETSHIPCIPPKK
jgi:acyl-CoA thioesterase I